jgi:peptide/nickel transport system permease protein
LSVVPRTLPGAEAVPAPPGALVRSGLLRHPGVVFGSVVLAALTVMAIFAPWLGTGDPLAINPVERLKPPSESAWLGTDFYGRDLYTRVVYGARISLVVGITVATLAITIGLTIGLLAGYIRWLDAVIMRIMDGLMAIPAILLALALMALMKASVRNVIIALIIPEIPRVIRLVRGSVLSLRELTMVEAARALGATSCPRWWPR